MADVKDGNGRSSQSLLFEEIVPDFVWTEGSDSHCLIIDLPGFKKEEVRLHIDNFGHIMVTGQRQGDGGKYFRFKQSYEVPVNLNSEQTRGKFEDEILYVIIPKRATAGEEGLLEIKEKGGVTYLCEDSKDFNNRNLAKGDEEEEFHDAKVGHGWKGDIFLETMKGKIVKNKGIFKTAVLAFSLGFFVSRRLQSCETL